jgi:hypothetical protein
VVAHLATATTVAATAAGQPCGAELAMEMLERGMSMAFTTAANEQ